MFVVLLIALFAAVVVVPVATFAAVRAVGRAFDMVRAERGGMDGSLDARLSRIEEAIDAMALQLDRVSRQIEGQAPEPVSDRPRLRAPSDVPED